MGHIKHNESINSKMVHFRFLNIPVTIHPSFWITLLFFSDIIFNPTIYSLIICFIFAFSLLVHEYGHAVTARCFGSDSHITLEAFGGHASYDPSKISPFKGFLITLNGPLLESVLIFIPYFLLKSHGFDYHPYIRFALYATMRINIIWCLLNLIPILPLDGGYLARYLLGRKFGVKGVKASILLGLGCVVVIAPYLFMRGHYYFGGLLLIFAYQNYQMLQQHNQSSSENSHSPGNDKALSLSIPNESTINLKKLIKSKNPETKANALQSLAKQYFEESNFKKAYKLLQQVELNFLTDGKHLLYKLAFDHGNYQFVAEHSRAIYQIEPSFETAIINSKAYAKLGKPYLAGGWLETASLFGAQHLQEVITLKDSDIFNTVRGKKEFDEFINKITDL